MEKQKLDLDLEEEKVYQFLALSQRKKNYVGVYKGGPYVDVKGMSAKKSNTPPFIFKAFNEVTEILKKINNMDEFEKEKENIIKITRSYVKRIGKPIEKKGFEIEDYAVTIRLSKAPSSYDGKPQHIRAAEKLEKITKKKFTGGDYITFVKTRNGVKPISRDLDDKHRPDISDINVKKYEENLQNVFEQLLDALDISWEEIKGTKKLDAFGI